VFFLCNANVAGSSSHYKNGRGYICSRPHRMPDTAEDLSQVLSEHPPFPRGKVCRPSPSIGVAANVLNGAIQSLEDELERVARSPAPRSDLITSLLANSTRSLTLAYKTDVSSTLDAIVQLWKLLGGDICWSAHTLVSMWFPIRSLLLTSFL